MKHQLLILFLIFYSSFSIGGDAKLPAAVKEKAQSFQPAFELSYLASSSLSSVPHEWSQFAYSNNGKWPYGVILILWNQETLKPIWGIDWPGDYSPHSKSWLDLNGDGNKDWLFFAGFEEVFSTYVYIWNGKNTGYSPDYLKQVYKNENDYSVLVDFENDGHPEIISSGYEGETHIESHCGPKGRAGFVSIPNKVNKDLTNKYNELVGKFDRVNFTYNMPDSYPAISMKILNPIKIIRIEGVKAVDVTSQYFLHLKWRLELLKKIRAENSKECHKNIDFVINYIKKRIDNNSRHSKNKEN